MTINTKWQNRVEERLESLADEVLALGEKDKKHCEYWVELTEKYRELSKVYDRIESCYRDLKVKVIAMEKLLNTERESKKTWYSWW